MPARRYDTVVVGAGFSGAVIAERLSAAGERVLVVDQSPHVGGCAHDHLDEQGVLVHAYGAHVFHTNSEVIIRYLSRFTEWRPYEHRVRAVVGSKLVPMPINRTTVNELLDLDLRSEAEVARFFEREREELPPGGAKTSEQRVCSRVGRTLYELLYRDYTRKHWKRDASELHASVTGRLPVRTNDDDRYFSDRYQLMPADGFSALFDRMLEGIDVRLGIRYEDLRVAHRRVVYTGRIDEFFDYEYGPLPFVAVRFEAEHRDRLSFPVGVLNHPEATVPFTRAIEYRHITGQQGVPSAIHYEFPSEAADPHYPVPTKENWALYRSYRALAEREAPHVTFAGRAGRFQYLTMDQVVGQALRIAASAAGARAGKLRVTA